MFYDKHNDIRVPNEIFDDAKSIIVTVMMRIAVPEPATSYAPTRAAK